LHEPSEL